MAVDLGILLTWAAVTFFTPVVLALVPLTRRRISDRVLHGMLGFSAGLLLAIALFDILPEAHEISLAAGLDVRLPALAAAIGFVALLVAHRVFVSRGVHFHEEEGRRIQPFGTLALGALTVHGLVDGIVIPLAFTASAEAGLVIGLAILLHQVPDSFAALTLALSSGRRGKKAALFVLATAVDTPIGIALGLLFVNAGAWLVPLGLGFSAGTFLYVSAADLIPELQHRAQSASVALSIVAGIAVVALLSWFLPL